MAIIHSHYGYLHLENLKEKLIVKNQTNHYLDNGTLKL